MRKEKNVIFIESIEIELLAVLDIFQKNFNVALLTTHRRCW